MNTRLQDWPEAIDTACHVINRVYLHKLLKKTSYELLTGKKPNVSYFRVFGARCWIKDPHHTSKFAPKAHEGFMLGYGKDSHSYRVFNLFHYKVVETVNVRFDAHHRQPGFLCWFRVRVVARGGLRTG